ncbi:MAG: DUF885 domain-containing protein [Lachnospiraceae bacterium]|nr:DUF885 domain-containing protein [Lachnospiraceae bacterium]
MIFLSCLFVFGYTLVNDRRTFAQLSREIFINELTANTLNLHYTIAYPENFGIVHIPKLTPYVAAEIKSREDELNDIIMSLEGITPVFLAPDDNYTYNLLKAYLLNLKNGQRFHFYDEPFSPSSGAQVMLPILLNDYVFRSASDVENYLQILDQIDDYLAGLCIFAREKAAVGLFMPDRIIDRIIEQCDIIIGKNEILSGTHFLQISFKERLKTLADNGLISAEEMNGYLAENDRLLLTVVAPAYIRTGDELFLLKGSGKNEMGLAHFAEGKEYYLHLLAQSTGTKRGIEEIKEWLFKDFRQNYNELISLLRLYPALMDNQDEADLPFIIDTPEAMLKDLEEKMAADFPRFTAEVELILKNVSPAMEDYASPAYYLSPPIDYYLENTIYINQKNNLTGLSLYTTLAHEGYPGHLYQTVFNRYFMEKTNGNPLRHILHFGGYQEGWALYVEMEAFDFAKSVMMEKYPEVEFLYEYLRLNHALQLGLYSLLDIAIHYDGADLEQVRKILVTIGIVDKDVALSIFDYIISEPANYPKYYLGFLEITNLKNEAKSLWGEKYSDYEFHRVFLEAGPSDFATLHKVIRGGR